MTHEDFLEALAAQNARFEEMAAENNRILDAIRRITKEQQEWLNIYLSGEDER